MGDGGTIVREEVYFPSSVREMAPEDRPRERLMRLGPEALRDAELLAVLFRTGTRRVGAVALADQLLRHFGDLRALARASVEEIWQVPGVGPVKAVEIKAALELGMRLARHSDKGRHRIRCSQDVVDYLMPRFRNCEVEVFKCLLLNTKHEVLKVLDISHGGIDGTAALPSDVFRQAVREGAKAVIVCHNHPSGDPEPSQDDIRLTQRLAESGSLLAVTLVDHIVFGDGRHVSLKERNYF
jgi:DNA repair protein RadC